MRGPANLGTLVFVAVAAWLVALAVAVGVRKADRLDVGLAALSLTDSDQEFAIAATRTLLKRKQGPLRAFGVCALFHPQLTFGRAAF